MRSLGEKLDKETSHNVVKNFRLFSLDQKIEIEYVAKKLGMNHSTLCMRLIRENITSDFAENLARVLNLDVEHLLVKLPLYINPEIKKFLEYEENQKKVIALVDYLKKGYTYIFLFLNPEMQEFFERKDVREFFKYKKNREDILTLINYHKSF